MKYAEFKKGQWKEAWQCCMFSEKQTSLSAQMHVARERKLLGALAHPVAERFKTHLWGYPWALLEIPFKPDPLKPSNVLKPTEFPIPPVRPYNMFCSVNFPDFLMLLMKGQVCARGDGALVGGAWALWAVSLASPLWSLWSWSCLHMMLRREEQFLWRF